MLTAPKQCARVNQRPFDRKTSSLNYVYGQGFSEDVEVVETSYQMLEVLFLWSGEGLNSFDKNDRANFSLEKSKINKDFGV